MKKRVLITGASGFVGYHLIQAALSQGLEVYAHVRDLKKAEHLKAFPINYVELDLASIYQLKKHIETQKYDYIIHAAGLTKAKNAEEYIQVNAIYARNLALASVSSTHQVRKFVLISSLAALGPLNQKHAKISDVTSAHPVTKYGRSKALAETYLNLIENLPLIVFRPTAVYGPRERDIFILIKSIKAGLELYIGNEEQELSFIYVTDLAELVIQSLTSGIRGKSYNLSDGAVYNRYALAKHVRDALNKKTFKVNVPLSIIKGLAWTMEQSYGWFNKMPTLNVDKIKDLTAKNWSCEIKNIQKDFGFEPRFGLEQGLGETIKWYRKNNWL